MMTLRSFLSTYAIRAKDSLDEIDWCSSNNSTDCALPNIAIPTLITAMGAHYFIRDSEIHYERSASRDKEFIVIAGATHVHLTLHRLRDDARAVWKQREELLRPRDAVDQRPVLNRG